MRFLADENFNGRIVRGLLLRLPTLDLLRVQEAGLLGTDDPGLLAWCADRHRIMLTHDAETMTAYAFARLRQGLPMPGVLLIPALLPIGRAIEDLVLIVESSQPAEWDGLVRHLPL